MKKFAYTLAEVLIAMSIIGVIAAIAAPAISNARPDANKFMYLRVYDNLTRITQELASNSEIFLPIAAAGENPSGVARNVSNVPLMNWGRGRDGRFPYEGRTKYGRILADVIGGTNITQPAADQVRFDTPEGRWNVIYQRSWYGDGNGGYMYRVLLDTDPSDGQWQYNLANPNRKHDTYEFWVNAGGSTIPVDLLGQMYVGTRLVTTSSRRINELVEEGIRAGRYINGGNFNQFDKLFEEDWPQMN